MELTIVERISKVGSEVAFVRIIDGSIFDTRRDVYVVGIRSARAVRNVKGNEVFAVRLVSTADFNHTVVERVAFAFSVRVFGGTTVAHLTVALELSVCQLQAVVEIPVSEVDDVLEPSLSDERVDIVVVTETVAFVDFTVGIVKVVLEHVGIVGEVAFGVLVGIHPIATAEEVTHCFVVRSTRPVHADTCLESHVVVKTMVERRVEDEVLHIAVTVFEDVARAAIFRTHLFAFEQSKRVDVVETIPIELTLRNVVFPQVLIVFVSFGLVVEVRRQVAIVVGTRVRDVIPIERRRRVER